jgi:DNA polymerase-3 subunit beta
MNFVCKRADLIHGVQTVVNAVSNRNTLPILSNILFETDKDGLMLSATDLEVSIKCQIAAEVAAPGSITIPAKRLSEIVRELPDKDITITVSSNSLVTLVCDKSIFKLNGLPKDDYPVLPKVKNDKGFMIAQKSLQTMIRKTIFSVSTDETRYVLNGVLFVVEEDLIRLVSTDGHRLSLIDKKLEKAPTQKIYQIVPAKALQELNKILEEEGEVNVQLSDNQIIFTTPQIVLMSRLIDGQFPNYDQVIPKQTDKKVLFNTNLLLSATRRVSLMASDKSNSVKYSISKDKLTITAITPEVGEAQEEMDMEYSGETITVAFNAKYVLDVLKNIASDNCVVELTTSLNPGVFKPEKSEENYMCVVMPMRL